MFSKQDKPRFFFYRSIERIEITYATMVISIHEITHILYVFLISLIHTTSTPLLQFALLNMVLYAVWKFNTQRSGWILARQKKNINTKCHLRIAIVMIWSAYFSRLDTLRSNYMSVTSTAYWWWAAMKLINILKAMVMRWSITNYTLHTTIPFHTFQWATTLEVRKTSKSLQKRLMSTSRFHEGA